MSISLGAVCDVVLYRSREQHRGGG